MLQLLQDLRRGGSEVVVTPTPVPRAGSFLVRTRCSVVSSGTERMLVDFGRAGWFGKARQQPERLRAVMNKVRTDGPIATWRAIRAKLEMPIPLGYCNVGDVLECGGSTEVQPGQRVVSNSPHAEVVLSPHQLTAVVPDGVADETSAFVPLSAIALEGIDLLQVRAGDRVVVTGLGLIGQLAVRILRALDCEVLGVDPVGERRALAEKHGAAVVPAGVTLVDAVMAWTKGQGAAGVIITASSSSNEIVNDAARSCRYRGRVVLVGVVGLQINRADFYRNEVSFQVSCSYGRRDHTGPGSVQANFRRVLAAMEAGRLPVEDLITHRFPFASAPAAYEVLRSGGALGIVLDYRGPGAAVDQQTLLAREITLRSEVSGSSTPRLALLGAGNFAVRTLLPALQRQGVVPTAVVSHQGAAALFAARKFGAAWAGTDETRVWKDPNVEAVILTTRHDAHVAQAVAALTAGKHVWVEKPLAISAEGLREIRAALPVEGAAQHARRPVLTVGFNRRFAPIATRLREAVARRGGPIEIQMRVNAGRLDIDHWTLNPKVGGGRIVGEGCHFIDLARYLTASPIASARCLRRDANGQDGGTFELRFQDGSRAQIDYRTDLPPHIPKEMIEVKGNGFSAEIHNWSRLRSRGLGGLWKGGFWSRAPRKGHDEALAAFLSGVKSNVVPIPLGELFEVSAWAIRLQAMVEGDDVTEGAFPHALPLTDNSPATIKEISK
jgi:predicted dehydrogenase/threonine dehydrogenase-like Zn-dependent dehydrogenase